MCVRVYVSVCMAESVQEVRVFDMDGCLHDELWYFVPNVHNVPASEPDASLTEQHTWEEFFILVFEG